MNYIQSQVIAAQDEIINQLTAERDAALADCRTYANAMYKREEQITTLKSALREALEYVDFYLAANDPSEFGCACDPSVGHLCGPCYADKQQYPLRKAIATINEVIK